MVRMRKCTRILTELVFVLVLFANIGFGQNSTEKGGKGKVEKKSEKRAAAQEIHRKGLREAERGEWRSAIRAYSFAMKTDHDFAPAYLKRAEAYQQLKRDKEAKADLLKYLKLNPKGADSSEVKSLLAALRGEPMKQEQTPAQETETKKQDQPVRERGNQGPAANEVEEKEPREKPRRGRPRVKADEPPPTAQNESTAAEAEPIEGTTKTSGLSTEDSSFLITAGDDGDVVVWATSDWSQENAITAHEKGVRAMALSRDNKYLATGGKKDKMLKVWELDSGAPVKTMKMGKNVHSIDFSPDGKSVAVLTSDHNVTIIDTNGWETKGLFEAYKSELIAFSPDSEQIISLPKSKQIDIYSVQGGELSGRIWTNIKKDQRAVSFSPDGRLACSGRKVVQIIDVRTRGAAEVHHISGKGRAVVFSPDGKYLACGADKEIILWELIGDEHQSSLRGHEDDIVDLCFSRTGNLLASASRDKTVKVWKLDTKGLVTTLRPGEKTVQAVAFSR